MVQHESPDLTLYHTLQDDVVPGVRGLGVLTTGLVETLVLLDDGLMVEEGEIVIVGTPLEEVRGVVVDERTVLVGAVTVVKEEFENVGGVGVD